MVSRLFTALVFVAVFVSAFHQLITEDFWFHLRGGQMIAGGEFPRVDTYSYPSAGNKYLDLHWLFQWLVFHIHNLGGTTLAVWFRALLVTATFAVLFFIGRRDAPSPIVAAMVFCGALLASERFLVRPELITFLFLAITMYWVRRLEDGWTPPLLFLPLLFVAWVNSEGLFILGLVVLGAHALGSPRNKHLWIALGTSTAATFINPYFAEGALHPLVLFTRIDGSIDVYSSTIGEFLSPFDRSAEHPAASFFPWFLGILALGLAAVRRPKVTEILLIAAFLFLSFKARRNLALLAIVAVPILSRWFAVGWGSLRGSWERQSATLRSTVTYTLIALSFLGTLGYIHAIVTNRIYAAIETNRTFGPSDPSRVFAEKAVQFLRKHRVRGPIFSALSTGSYLTWAMPREPVFIDGRLEVHSTEHFARFLQIREGGSAWDEADEEFDFSIALLEHGRADALLQRLIREPNWAMVYLDGKALIVAKKNEANEELIQEFALTRRRLLDVAPGLDPAAPLLPPEQSWFAKAFGPRTIPWDALNLGQFLTSIQAHDLAAEQYRRATKLAPELATPRVLLAGALNQLQKPNEALTVVLSAEPKASTDLDRARIAVTKGDILLGGGQPAAAIAAYDEFLSNPILTAATPGAVQVNRARARLEAGDVTGALADVHAALQLLPQYPEAYRILGLAEEARGETNAALVAYQNYKQLGGVHSSVDEAIARLGGTP